MPELYLTPASISFLNQFLLAALILLYLAIRHFSLRQQQAPRQDSLLFVLLSAVSIFSFLLFLDVSFLPAERLIVVYLENTVLAILLIALIQFAYYFPAPNEKLRTERRIALIASCAYTLVEAGFAIWRFNRLRSGQVEFRHNLLDVVTALGFLWVIFIFGRNAIQHWKLPASRWFALTFLIPFWLASLNFVRSYYAISTTYYHISLSVGVVFTLFLFALTYLSSQPEKTSFVTKLSGVVLTSVMAVFGTVAWLVAPAYANQYSPAIPDHRTIHFVPNARGGYDVSEVPFSFEQDLGQDLDLIDEIKDRQIAEVEFEFPYFGKAYKKVYISNDGALGIGSQFTWREYQNHFTRVPLIIPLLVDINPGINDEGGVYLRRGADQIVVTYYRVPAYNHPEAIYTFQVVLYSNGSFDFTYNGLPEIQTYYVDDRPEAAAWAIGFKPSRAPKVPVDFTSLPLQSGPDGLIQDEYRSFRNYIHEFMLPLALAVLWSSLLFLIGLPLILNYTFARPLNSLLKGVQALNDGQRGVSVPHQFNDEIGFLTESFNHMSAELKGLITDLESRVASRTSDLLAANEQLHKLTIVIEQSPNRIIITDTEARIEYVNPSFTHSTGYTFEEVKGQNPRILKSNLTPAVTYDNLWSTITSGNIWRGELINRRKNGEDFWEYMVIAPIFNTEGKTTHYVAVKEDITERVRAEHALRESETRYRQLFDLESDAIFIIRNSDGQILAANNAASELYGFTREELLARKNTDLSAEPKATQKATDSPAPVEQVIQIPLRWHRKKDHTVFPVSITARFITWNEEFVHLAAIRDITEQYRIEQELVKLAVTDALTSLPNRRHFFSQAELFFSRAHEPPFSLAVMMLDIDYFKKINDQYGHAAGDAGLREVARILGENLRPTDLLARVGGEEFAVLLPRTFALEACQIGQRLCEILADTPIHAGDFEFRLTISIGVAALDETIGSLDELLSRADQALYEAKAAGRNRCEIWSRKQ